MRLFLRLVSWLVYWMAPGEEELRLEKYTMPRRGFTYKNGRADEAVPTWMVNSDNLKREDTSANPVGRRDEGGDSFLS